MLSDIDGSRTRTAFIQLQARVEIKEGEESKLTSRKYGPQWPQLLLLTPKTTSLPILRLSTLLHDWTLLKFRVFLLAAHTWKPFAQSHSIIQRRMWSRAQYLPRAPAKLPIEERQKVQPKLRDYVSREGGRNTFIQSRMFWKANALCMAQTPVHCEDKGVWCWAQWIPLMWGFERLILMPPTLTLSEAADSLSPVTWTATNSCPLHHRCSYVTMPSLLWWTSTLKTVSQNKPLPLCSYQAFGQSDKVKGILLSLVCLPLRAGALSVLFISPCPVSDTAPARHQVLPHLWHMMYNI